MAVLGFIDGLGDALVSVSQALSGYASDRLRRRKVFIWAGYLMGAVSRVGYALSTSWHSLVPLRALDRMGKIRSAPRDAVIADVSTDQNRGRNFGFLRSMDNLGAVCGIIICMLFMDLGYQNLFLIAAVPSVVGALLLLKFYKEVPAHAAKAFKGLSLSRLNRDLRLFVLLSALFALGTFSYSFLIIFARDEGVEMMTLPVLYLIFTVVAAVFSLPFGRLADHVGRKPVIMMSFVFWGLACGGFLLLRAEVGAFLSFVLYGLHKASIEPVQKAFVSEMSAADLRASTLGGFQMVIGLCALPSSLIAGFLWTEAGKSAPLFISICLTILSTVLLLFVHENRSTVIANTTPGAS